MRFMRFAALAVVLLSAACAGYIDVETRHPVPPAGEPEKPERKVAEHPAHLGIPPGHLPPPGQCKIWYPDRPPGHQPAPGPCEVLERQVPPGAWLVHRPSRDRKLVRVSVYHTRQPGVLVVVRLYEAQSGRFVRAEAH